MKKLIVLARCVLALMVTMFAAMFYAPTASATTDPPISTHADAGKTFMTEQPVDFVVKIDGEKQIGHDYKDDPHIG